MEFLQLACSLAVGACITGAALANQGNYARAMDFVEADLRDRLRSLRIATPQLRRWIQAWIALDLAAVIAIWLSTQAAVIALSLGLLMAAGPWWLVRHLSAARRQKIEDQLADAMVMFSSAIRAGLSITQAMELLARECPSPIRQEFRQIVGEYQMGKPLERTLNEAKARLTSENFLLFAAALLASRESGGRLNETVERIATSVVELQRLERKIMSETAQARKSAVYMAIIPALLLVVYFFVDPRNTQLLFVTLPGQVILTLAVLLNLAAYLWALRILKADI